MGSRLPQVSDNSLHPGLVFDRGFRGAGQNNEKSRHVDRVAGLASPSDYTSVFNRWKATLELLRRAEDGSGATELVHLTSKARLVVGLGGESVIETSIALHRTYGVPFIPGSALKGVTRRFARQALGDAWAEGSFAFNTLFGKVGDDDSFRGVVTFHDALPLPGKWKLEPDTITVHHPKYYIGESDSAPSDSDDPVPVSLLTVTGDFIVPLTGPIAWVQAAKRILELALREGGIGAKTSIGYGRMEPVTESSSSSGTISSSSQRAASGPSKAAPQTPQWPQSLQVKLTLPTVRPGQTDYATGSGILPDGRQIHVTAVSATNGIGNFKPTKRGIGPALCDLEHQGRGHYRVISMKPIES